MLPPEFCPMLRFCCSPVNFSDWAGDAIQGRPFGFRIAFVSPPFRTSRSSPRRPLCPIPHATRTNKP
jgi:hypothetical protein